MRPPDPLDELDALFDRAKQLAAEVGQQLESGQAAEDLTPRLKLQVEAMTQLQTDLSGFEPDRVSRPREEVRQRIDRIRSEFKDLVDKTEANHALAAKRGVRVAGVGGRPYSRPREGGQGARK